MATQSEIGPDIPLVSIIVINYNYSAFLDESVASALNQDYAYVEVIVVDDASTDRSPNVIRAYGERVRPVLKGKNAGHAAAFNSGFEVSAGQIIMILDADDYLFPHAASAVVKTACAHVGFSLIQARLLLVDVEGRALDVYPPEEMAFDSGDVVPLLLACGRYSTTVTTGIAFCRAALAAVAPVPPDAFSRSADGYLTAVAPFFGPVVSIEDRIGAYRRHDSNHSRFSDGLAHRARWRLEHDAFRHAAMARVAAQRGLSMSENPGLKDPLHLEERLASLCIDPAHHPYSGDRRLRIALNGFRAAAQARLSRLRRLMLQLWFLAVGILPVGLARHLVSWKLSAASRPAFINGLAWRLRRLVG